MTIFHWYKAHGVELQNPVGKTKAISGCEQLGRRIGSILRENNSNEMLLRQQAGLDKSKKRLKCRKLTEPKVCKVQQNYAQNRRSNLQKMSKPQQSQIHLYPVPNFSLLHKLWEKRNRIRQMNSKQKFTEAVTPLTLINTMKADKKRKLELQRLEKEMYPQIKLASPSFNSWHKRPFVPHIESSIIKVKPFKLISVERGERRKQFDERQKREQELRWRYQAMDYARRWREDYMEIRKQTNFKAHPNPWKRIKAKK